MNKDQIIEALSYVEDPDLKKDLVSLGMIQDLTINGAEVA
jgi:ATP-binding protein involved in chromosome partitioning